MGRIIGDGGWYFHVADMAVHPDHQKKGLGDFILAMLLDKVEQEAPRQALHQSDSGSAWGQALFSTWVCRDFNGGKERDWHAEILINMIMSILRENRIDSDRVLMRIRSNTCPGPWFHGLGLGHHQTKDSECHILEQSKAH